VASLADALLKYNMLGQDTRAAAVAVAPIFLAPSTNRNPLIRISGGLSQQLNNLQSYSRRVISTLRAIAAEKIKQQTVIERIDRRERENRAEMVRLQPERAVEKNEELEDNSSDLVSSFLRILNGAMATIARIIDAITDGVRRIVGVLRRLIPIGAALLRAIPLLMMVLRRSPIGLGLSIGAGILQFFGERTSQEPTNIPTAPGRQPPSQSPSSTPSSSQSGSPERVAGGITEIVQSGAGFNVVRYDTGRIERRTGTRNWRNNNPGNIEFGDFARRYGAIGTDGRFAIFPTYETGRRAKEALLFETSSYSNLTIAQAITRYAPPTENNTTAYINTVANSIGVDPNTPLQNLTPQQRQIMLNSMERVEGFRPGNVQVIEPGQTYASREQSPGTPGNTTGEPTSNMAPSQSMQQSGRGPQVSLTPAITPSVQQTASYIPQQTSASMFILPVLI